jgi:hypothetical protein
MVPWWWRCSVGEEHALGGQCVDLIVTGHLRARWDIAAVEVLPAPATP